MANQTRALPWMAALLALVAIGVCLRLGFWQLERAQTKEAWQAQLATRQEQGMRSVTDLAGEADPGNYPVRVEGKPDNAHTVLLDNRMLERVAGYHVLTPVRLEDGRGVLLNRGWWPRGRERQSLPAVPALPEFISVSGQSYVYSDKVFTLADDDLSAPSWPLRVQKVEPARIAELVGYPLLPFEVRVAPGQALETGEQMAREWNSAVMGPERHRAYAVQWFAMAAALVVLTVLAAIRARHRNHQHLDA